MPVVIDKLPGSDLVWSKASNQSWASTATWADAKQGAYYKALITEDLSLADNRSAGYALCRAEAINTSESWKDIINWVQVIRESIAVKERKSNHTAVQMSDSFAIADTSRRSFELGATEDISLLDTADKMLTIVRKFTEPFEVAEVLSNRPERIVTEPIMVSGDMMHKAKAVIADIAFSVSPLDTDVPAGYSSFRKFIPGDYQYERAIIKTVLSGELGGRTALLKSLTVNVDLPDLTDRGTVSLGEGENLVNFAKEFYKVPEVSITMRSSTAGVVIPTITEITRNGFKVKLLNSEGGATAGTISWTAIGC